MGFNIMGSFRMKFGKSIVQAPILMLFLLCAHPVLAETAEPAVPSQPEKWSFLTMIGEEACPETEIESSDDEIIVCAKVSESDRYRIPKKLRDTGIETDSAQSWTSVVETLDESARAARPDSCSVVGSNGFTGCLAAALRQWFGERR